MIILLVLLIALLKMWVLLKNYNFLYYINNKISGTCSDNMNFKCLLGVSYLILLLLF